MTRITWVGLMPSKGSLQGKEEAGGQMRGTGGERDSATAEHSEDGGRAASQGVPAPLGAGGGGAREGAGDSLRPRGPGGQPWL